MSTFNSILKEIYKPYLQEQLNSPFLKAIRDEYQAKWDALHWHQKMWRLFKAEIRDRRRQVGFWIAGEKPRDY